jgi:hypothetical protein
VIDQSGKTDAEAGKEKDSQVSPGPEPVAEAGTVRQPEGPVVGNALVDETGETERRAAEQEKAKKGADARAKAQWQQLAPAVRKGRSPKQQKADPPVDEQEVIDMFNAGETDAKIARAVNLQMPQFETLIARPKREEKLPQQKPRAKAGQPAK